MIVGYSDRQNYPLRCHAMCKWFLLLCKAELSIVAARLPVAPPTLTPATSEWRSIDFIEGPYDAPHCCFSLDLGESKQLTRATNHSSIYILLNRVRCHPRVVLDPLCSSLTRTSGEPFAKLPPHSGPRPAASVPRPLSQGYVTVGFSLLDSSSCGTRLRFSMPCFANHLLTYVGFVRTIVQTVQQRS